MKEVPLRNGGVAIVDDVDYARFANAYCRRNSNGYVVVLVARIGRRQRWATMHRLILGAAPREFVDHVNWNRADNRRSNLRRCSRRQNMANSNRRAPSSQLKGVSRYRDRWRAQHNMKYLGLFDSPIAAALAYDAAALAASGEFAATNARLGLLP